MHLITAESKKLISSKVIVVLLLVLLVANFALTYHTSDTHEISDAVALAYAYYLKDPAACDAYYERLVAEREAWEQSGGGKLNFYFTIDESGEYSDYGLLSVLYDSFESSDAEKWESSIRKIIRLVDLKIADLRGYGYSEKTYTLKSQLLLRDRYEVLLGEVEMEREYSRGYDTYLGNDLVSAFLLVFLTLAISYIFLHDSSVGFHSILQLTKKGRVQTVFAKLGLTAILTVSATLLFSLSSFLAVGLTEGYSSCLSPIQNFPSFYAVPDHIQVWEYLLLHTLLRTGAFLVYGAFIAFLSSMRLPYIVCFGGGFALAGINAFLFYRSYAGTVPAIRYMNLVAMAEGCELTNFYRTVSVFRVPVRMSTVMLCVAAIAVLVLCGGAVACFCKNVRLLTAFGKRITAWRRSLTDRIRIKLRFGRARRLHIARGPLWCFELRKIRPVITLLFILLILLVRVDFVGEQVGSMENYGEALYYDYIGQIADLEDGERTAYLLAERTRINRIMGQYTSNKAKYENGEMSRTEYFEYMDLYEKTRNEDKAFERVEDYVHYLEEKNGETGLAGRIIYSTGYEKLFALGADYHLYVALIVLCFRVFSVEYVKNSSSGGFSQILCTTKKGRTRTFLAKLGIFLTGGAVLALLFRLSDIFTVKARFVMSDLDATLYSVESFRAVNSGITLGAYLILELFVIMFASVILALTVLLISCFFKKPFAILGVTAVLTALPQLVVSTVLTGLSHVSILSLTAPRELYCRAAREQLFGTESGYLIAVCLGYLAVAVLLAEIARRHFAGIAYPSIRMIRRKKR